MFIMETPYVSPGKTLKIEHKKISIVENGVSNNKFMEFNDLKELKPKLRYLDAKVGEIFIMNPNVFHSSDPRELKTNRVALNFRVIYKPYSCIKICINSSYYSRILLLRLELLRFYELFLKKKFIILKKNNNYLTKKLFY